MSDSVLEMYMGMYFNATWPSNVRSFMVAIIQGRYTVYATGIFFRKDAFLMATDCIHPTTNALVVMFEYPHATNYKRIMLKSADEHTSAGIVMIKVSFPAQHTEFFF